MFCPGHAGARENERADELAGQTEIGGTLSLGPATVLIASAQDRTYGTETCSRDKHVCYRIMGVLSLFLSSPTLADYNYN